MQSILVVFVFFAMYCVCQQPLAADTNDTITQKKHTSFYHKASAPGDFVFEEEEILEIEGATKNAQEDLEQIQFSPSKHNKNRQKTMEYHKKNDQPQRIHKEDENLEKISLQEQKPQTIRKYSAAAFEILFKNLWQNTFKTPDVIHEAKKLIETKNILTQPLS